jgi:inner membrane protein
MTLGVLFIDVVLLATGRLSIHGASDEVAHLLTALLWGVLAFSVGLPVSLPFVALGGVFPDLDHVPMFLVGMESLPGSSRSVLHTLLVVLIFLDLAWWHRRWRWMWGSLALGVASHLVRDMATGTVILLWPVSGRPFSLPYLAYLGTLVLCIVLPALMPRRVRDKPVARLHRRTFEESAALARHRPIGARRPQQQS